MGNVFALLGLRALFVLVESLIARFRYLDQTIAIVLGLVGVKLLIEDLVKIGPVPSLLIIAAAFTIGIVASIIADKRDPDAEEKQEERIEAMKSGAMPEPPVSASRGAGHLRGDVRAGRRRAAGARAAGAAGAWRPSRSVWDDPAVDWDAFDLTVVRSTWDYVGRRDEFLAWAESVPRLHNPAEVLRWNTDKRYLAELTEAGLPVVPTWFDELPEPGRGDRGQAHGVGRRARHRAIRARRPRRRRWRTPSGPAGGRPWRSPTCRRSTSKARPAWCS